MPPADGVGPRAHRLIRNVISAGGSQAGILLVSLAVTPVLVAELGLGRYGLWALAGVVVNYIGLLDLGVGSAFVRFLAAHHARGDDRRFNSVVALGLCFYGAFAVVVLPLVLLGRNAAIRLLAVRPELRDEASFLLLGATAILLLRSLFVVYRAALASIERLDVNNRIALAVAFPSGAGAIVAVKLGFGLHGLVLNGLATALATVALQTLAAHRLIPMLRPRRCRVDWSVAGDLLGYGLRIQAARVAELISGHVDKLILASLVSAASVGLYDLGLKLALLVGVLPTVLLPTVAPTSALLDACGDKDKLRALHARATKYVALVLAPAAVFVLLTAPVILRAWIGPETKAAAATAARLLVVASTPMLALGVSRLVARGIGRPRMEMHASLLTAAANVLLSVMLVRRLGALGAPLGSALAGIVGGCVFFAAFRRETAASHRLAVLRPMVRPAVAACFAGVVASGGLAVARLASFPSTRAGALGELALAGAPFVAVYLAFVLRPHVLDEYDHSVARQTWGLARGALRRTEVGR